MKIVIRRGTSNGYTVDYVKDNGDDFRDGHAKLGLDTIEEVNTIRRVLALSPTKTENLSDLLNALVAKNRTGATVKIEDRLPDAPE